MTTGAFPVGILTDDLTIERELLEAPDDGETLIGGWDWRPAHSLEEALEAWHRETWGSA